MGEVVDYFRPRATETVCSMLQSQSKHVWSANAGGPFVTPTSYHLHMRRARSAVRAAPAARNCAMRSTPSSGVHN